jgi:hypothetical protein
MLSGPPHLADLGLHIRVESSALDSGRVMKDTLIRLSDYFTLRCLLAVVIIGLLPKFAII